MSDRSRKNRDMGPDEFKVGRRVQTTPAPQALVISTLSGMSRKRLFIAGSSGGNSTPCIQFNFGSEQLR